jgi:hypothetical protein
MNASSPAPVPLLKRPVWTWEVPVYFFVGGAAGTAAVVAAVSDLKTGPSELVDHARWVAAVGAVLAAPLLISDLGRPSRFLNMLRVFKRRSPMSVGAWTLMLFSAAAVASLAGHFPSMSDVPFLPRIADAAGIVAAASGLVLATYTGVLIGVTAIPVWAAHVRVLPILFGLSGLGAAVSILELLGDRAASLNLIGIGVAVVETALLFWFERRGDPRSAVLHSGQAATLIRTAGALSGPLALAARLLSHGGVPVRLVAAVAMIAGSLLTRFGWIAAGRASAADVSIALR